MLIRHNNALIDNWMWGFQVFILVFLIFFILKRKFLKISNIKNKTDLRIISKLHAHFETMTKTPVKFEKDRHKTVGGVAHTGYPVSIHFNCIRAWKMAKLKMRKKRQKLIWGLYPNQDKNNYKVSKRLAEKCRSRCPHKVPSVRGVTEPQNYGKPNTHKVPSIFIEKVAGGWGWGLEN